MITVTVDSKGKEDNRKFYFEDHWEHKELCQFINLCLNSEDEREITIKKTDGTRFHRKEQYVYIK